MSNSKGYKTELVITIIADNKDALATSASFLTEQECRFKHLGDHIQKDGAFLVTRIEHDEVPDSELAEKLEQRKNEIREKYGF